MPELSRFMRWWDKDLNPEEEGVGSIGEVDRDVG